MTAGLDNWQLSWMQWATALGTRGHKVSVCVCVCMCLNLCKGTSEGDDSREAIAHAVVCHSPLTSLWNFWETCWLTEAADPGGHWHLLITDNHCLSHICFCGGQGLNTSKYITISSIFLSLIWGASEERIFLWGSPQYRMFRLKLVWSIHCLTFQCWVKRIINLRFLCLSHNFQNRSSFNLLAICYISRNITKFCLRYRWILDCKFSDVRPYAVACWYTVRVVYVVKWSHFCVRTG